MDGFWLRKRLMLCCLICTVILQTLVSETADITLADAAARTGTDLYWDPLTGSGIFSKNGHQVAFRVGQQLMLLDYTRIAVTDPPVMSDGTAYVTEQFVADAAALFDVNLPEAFYRVGAILIDPGHGGKDPGTIGTYKKNGKEITLYEKDIALSVSNKLADQLRNAYPDKKIIMTRSDDTWLSLEQRVDIANSIQLEPHEAIIYISVHVNASLNKTASGYEVWYLTPDYRRTVLDSSNIDADDEALIPILNSMLEEEYTTESVLIAKFIMDGLTAQIGNDSPSRGIKAEEWFVVRNANMPSVLVETGFVTNEKEAELLGSDDYLRKIALGIYNGVVAFVTHFERSRGFTGLL